MYFYTCYDWGPILMAGLEGPRALRVRQTQFIIISTILDIIKAFNRIRAYSWTCRSTWGKKFGHCLKSVAERVTFI